MISRLHQQTVARRAAPSSPATVYAVVGIRAASKPCMQLARARCSEEYSPNDFTAGIVDERYCTQRRWRASGRTLFGKRAVGRAPHTPDSESRMSVAPSGSGVPSRTHSQMLKAVCVAASVVSRQRGCRGRRPQKHEPPCQTARPGTREHGNRTIACGRAQTGS